MIIVPPTPFIRKRKASPQTPAGLTIVNVVNGSSFTLKVYFSAPITWDGTTVPAAFCAFTGDGIMDGCIYVDSVGSDWIELEFNADVAIGAAWQLLSAMDGITPAVMWPQSGVVGT